MIVAISKAATDSGSWDWAPLIAATGAVLVGFWNWLISRNGVKSAHENGKSINALLEANKSYKESFDKHFSSVLKQMNQLQETLARTLRAMAASGQAQSKQSPRRR